MEKVFVLYTEFENKKKYDFKNIIECLQTKDKLKAKKLNYNRKVHFIIGRKLLERGITVFGSELKLIDINFLPGGKPYFKKDISFSISHSNEIVCCAVSTKNLQLGIDIEYQQAKELKAFSGFFTQSEREKMLSDKQLIYDFWTKKEALIKANNGSLFQMNKIDCTKKIITYNNSNWYSYKLNLHKNYTTNLITNKRIKVNKYYTPIYLLVSEYPIYTLL